MKIYWTSLWVLKPTSLYVISPEFNQIMTNVYSFDGLIVLGLLVICTCAYLRSVPRLKKLLFSEKKGFLGALYKASVIGTRLHWVVSVTCVLMAFYVLFIK